MTEAEQKVVNNEFLKSAIKRQMMRCASKERYRSGIFIVDENKKKLLDDIIKDYSEKIFTEYLVEKYPIKISRYGTEVYFKNGSTLRIVKAIENSRGNKFHDIIYDSNVENNIVSMIVLACHVPYYTTNNENDEVRSYERIVECDM